jgi:hypothetical protein
MRERGVAGTFNLPSEDGETSEIRANADLIVLAPDLARWAADAAFDLSSLLDYIGVDVEDDPDLLASFDAPSCVVSAARSLARLAAIVGEGNTT